MYICSSKLQIKLITAHKDKATAHIYQCGTILPLIRHVVTLYTPVTTST